MLVSSLLTTQIKSECLAHPVVYIQTPEGWLAVGQHRRTVVRWLPRRRHAPTSSSLGRRLNGRVFLLIEYSGKCTPRVCDRPFPPFRRSSSSGRQLFVVSGEGLYGGYDKRNWIMLENWGCGSRATEGWEAVKCSTDSNGKSGIALFFFQNSRLIGPFTWKRHHRKPFGELSSGAHTSTSKAKF